MPNSLGPLGKTQTVEPAPLAVLVGSAPLKALVGCVCAGGSR